jgi:hypothetical protein
MHACASGLFMTKNYLSFRVRDLRWFLLRAPRRVLARATQQGDVAHQVTVACDPEVQTVDELGSIILGIHTSRRDGVFDRIVRCKASTNWEQPKGSASKIKSPSQNTALEEDMVVSSPATI